MNNNEWLDIEVLEDYLDGKLDAKAMHRIERLSLEDPFVAEALAGLSLSSKRVQSLSLLQKQLQERVAQKPIVEKRWQITSQRLSIAAAAAVLFVTVSLLFWMRESNNRDQLAAGEPRKVEAVIAPDEKSNAEVDKVITDAEKPIYAANSKKINKKRADVVVPVSPVPQLEALNDEVSIKTASIQERSEVASKSVNAALEGKVAGVQVGKNLIRGTVYDEDKLPIPGASVKFKEAKSGVVTDSKGMFSLIPDTLSRTQKLSVASIGFVSKEVTAKKEQNLAIELKPDYTSLNEVVITGSYGAKRTSTAAASKVFIGAEPVGGLIKFEEYVMNNNKLLTEKKLTGRFVTVYFDLDKDGNPINIKARRNFSMVPQQTEAEEKEAIRLVKEGPKWIAGSSINTAVNIKF